MGKNKIIKKLNKPYIHELSIMLISLITVYLIIGYIRGYKEFNNLITDYKNPIIIFMYVIIVIYYFMLVWFGNIKRK